MQFKQTVSVTGLKRSKGDFEGVAFDATKVFVETDLDDSKGNARGMASTEYTIGTSLEYDKYATIALPFKADVTFELVTTGKTSKVMIIEFKALELKKAA